MGTGYQARQAQVTRWRTAASSATGSVRASPNGTTCPTPTTTSSSRSSARSSASSARSACWPCSGCSPTPGMRIARRSADPFLRLLTATTTLWVLGQAFINVGYVVGMLPVTGLQLPLISAGGTSTATTLVHAGDHGQRGAPRTGGGGRAAGGPRRQGRTGCCGCRCPSRTCRRGSRRSRDRKRTGRQARTRRPSPSRQPPRRPEPGKPKPPQPVTPERRDRRTTPGQGIMDGRQRQAGRRRGARSRSGRSALRVNDTVMQPTGGQGQRLADAGRISGQSAVRRPGRRWHRRARRARDGRRRRARRRSIRRSGSPPSAPQRGLETRLVPERGYHLELITPVPLPRKPIR